MIVAVLLALFSLNDAAAQSNREHIEVALRTIGHYLLLQSNDSTSRVLPIRLEKDKFRINFATDFTFEPTRLITTTDSIFRVARISDRYRLEVENTDSNEVVYSYEMAPKDSGMVPCGQRAYPKANYSVLISLLDNEGELLHFDENSPQKSEEKVVEKQSGFSKILLVAMIAFVLILLGAIMYRRKNPPQQIEQKSNHSWIGNYQFDQRNMKLIFNNESIELTSKETDLLALLHSSIDQTIEREKILQVVWGDEGDYVGRTLDVFISKLRKKFSEDENVRIVNVRGVGYRLMLSEV